MIKVLINAYAVSPNWGSELGIGWNVIINLAKYAKVFAITESEYRNDIGASVKLLPQTDNIVFYYNSVSDHVREMCRNQGDWCYYYYYSIWQKKTYEMALEIIDEENIDVVHQLNMGGFREPGYLWRIKNRPFVWGAISGLDNFPLNYAKNAGVKQYLFYLIKNFITSTQLRFAPRVIKSMKRADFLFAATSVAQKRINSTYNKDILLIPDTGCNVQIEPNNIERFNNNGSFDVVWVGKFDFRKQLGLALRSIAKEKELNGLKFHIIGSGSPSQIVKYKLLAQKLGLADICIWHGAIPNAEVHKLMSRSHLFFFSSIMEATSTVILEAIGSGLPILCHNACGFASVVNEDIGLKIELSNPKRSVDEFSEKLEYLYNNRELLKKMSQSCANRQKELSWDSKAQQMVGIYKQVRNR